jgi:hypothetical protein
MSVKKGIYSLVIYFFIVSINGWCRNLFFQMAQGGYPRDSSGCVKVRTHQQGLRRSPQECVQKMLQILEAGLGISVKI